MARLLVLLTALSILTQEASPQDRKPDARKSPPSKQRSAATSGRAIESGSEFIELESQPELLVGPTRVAWCSAMSPDETWIATGYGLFRELGQVRIWNVNSGESKWHAREPSGVRTVAISPDGSLVASGNFGGEITLRDAATGRVVRQLREFRGSLERLSFSSDGRRLASASNRRMVRIWDVATGRVLKTFDGHVGSVYWVEFSADDRVLLTAGQDKTVRLWDVETGEITQTLVHPELVTSAIFLPDGKRIATACIDGQVRIFSSDGGSLLQTLSGTNGTPSPVYVVAASQNGAVLAAAVGPQIQIWNAADWQLQATITGHGDVMHGLSLSKDGKTLISSGVDSVVGVWDVAEQKQRHALSPPSGDLIGAGPVRTLAISPDGALLAVAPGDRVVHLRDRTGGGFVRTLAGHDDVVNSAAFSPDGLTLATAGADGRVRLWDVQRGAARGSLSAHTGAAASVTWSPDGGVLATGGNDKTVRLWNAAAFQQLTAFEGHTDGVTAVAFAPDGRRLYSAGRDNLLRVWDVAKRTAVATLDGHTAPIRAVAVSTDGRTIATASEDNSVGLWDAATLRRRATLIHPQSVETLAFAPRGTTLASGGADATIRLWDSASGAERKALAGHTGAITGLAFVRDGSALVSGSNDRSLRIWKAPPTPVPPLLSMLVHRPQAQTAEFSPNGKWLATGGSDRAVALRDPVTGKNLRVLRGHTGLIYHAAFSPDSKLLATAANDGTVRVWSMDRGDETARFDAWRDQTAAARCVAFSPDGGAVASGCTDGTIKLWDVAENNVKAVFAPQPLPVTSVKFSPDGALLASATGDWQTPAIPGELRLWDPVSGAHLASLDGHTGEIKRLAFDRDGRRLASSSADRTVIVWSVADRAMIGGFQPERSATGLAFLPDGERLAVAESQGGVAIWSVSTGSIIQRYEGHGSVVPAITCSPDGQRLATASHDGSIKVWPVERPSGDAP